MDMFDFEAYLVSSVETSSWGPDTELYLLLVRGLHSLSSRSSIDPSSMASMSDVIFELT
jgi:hypothetical protein